MMAIERPILFALLYALIALAMWFVGQVMARESAKTEIRRKLKNGWLVAILFHLKEGNTHIFEVMTVYGPDGREAVRLAVEEIRKKRSLGDRWTVLATRKKRLDKVIGNTLTNAVEASDDD